MSLSVDYFCLFLLIFTVVIFIDYSDIQHAQRVLARNHLGRWFFAVICHKITVKCRWNHGENFTAKIYKLGPKCRWNILIVGENTATKNFTYIHVHVSALHVFFCLFGFVFFTISYCIFQFQWVKHATSYYDT